MKTLAPSVALTGGGLRVRDEDLDLDLEARVSLPESDFLFTIFTFALFFFSIDTDLFKLIIFII